MNGGLYKMYSRPRLCQMDFLNIPAKLWRRTQPSDIRHPGSDRAFQDVHVPELLDTYGTLRKSHFPPQGAEAHFLQAACAPKPED